jgi:hypothetical protein
VLICLFKIIFLLFSGHLSCFWRRPSQARLAPDGPRGPSSGPREPRRAPPRCPAAKQPRHRHLPPVALPIDPHRRGTSRAEQHHRRRRRPRAPPPNARGEAAPPPLAPHGALPGRPAPTMAHGEAGGGGRGRLGSGRPSVACGERQRGLGGVGRPGWKRGRPSGGGS